MVNRNGKYIERYKDLNICVETRNTWYYVEEYPALAFATIDVAKRCIDNMLIKLS